MGINENGVGEGREGRIAEIVSNFFSSVSEENLKKISMRALVYNINKYYDNKAKIE